MKQITIELQHVQKSYVRPVLRDINLRLPQGGYYAVLGRSGSGKSTLLHILGLIERHDGGRYLFDGTELRPGKDYAALRRRHIGFIFQSYNLIPTLTCRENIRLPLLFERDLPDRSEEWMERLDIAALRDQRTAVLSGGEKQRVGFARAMMADPGLLLADEPTGNLDGENRDVIFSILRQEHAAGRSVMLITHDAEAASQAQEVFHLENGVLTHA
jgi:putative ABC transport system ATP-binding protein